LWGAAPLLAWKTKSATAGVVLLAIWIVGWLALGRAAKRDPDLTLLRAYLKTRAFKSMFVILFLFAQYFALVVSGSSALILVLVTCTVIALLWANSSSVGKLSQRSGRLCLLVVVLSLSVFAIEVVLRIAAWQRPANVPGKVTWGHQVVNNTIGFRERDFKTPKPQDIYRIMVIGDSLTWGAGLPVEKRYTNLMESDLQARFPGLKIEVLNFGLSGGPTVRERNLLKRYIGMVHPDAVVIGFCINDPQPRPQYHCVELESYEPFRRTLTGTLHDVGLHRLAGAFDLRSYQVLCNIGLVPQWPEALDRSYQAESKNWREFVVALEDIRKLCDIHLMPAPVFVPLLQGNGDFNQPNEQLAHIVRWCRQAEQAAAVAGHRTVNLEADFRAQGDMNRWVNQWDGHPNAQCNQVYAKRLAEVLAPNVNAWAESDTRNRKQEEKR